MRKLIFICLLGFSLTLSHMQTFAHSLTSSQANLVPVRQVGESLGYKVIWDVSTQSVTISSDSSSANLSPNSLTCTLSDQSVVTLIEAPQLIDGTLFVSPEFWSQVFNIDVKIDEGNLTIKKTDTCDDDSLLDDIVTPVHPGINEVYTHQKLGVTLAQNPSTGYIWEIKFPSQIQVISDTFSPDNQGLLGAPGTRHWLIRATEPGTYTLTFNYVRPFDPTNPVDVQTFIIEAKDFVPPTT